MSEAEQPERRPGAWTCGSPHAAVAHSKFAATTLTTDSGLGNIGLTLTEDGRPVLLGNLEASPAAINRDAVGRVRTESNSRSEFSIQDTSKVLGLTAQVIGIGPI